MKYPVILSIFLGLTAPALHAAGDNHPNPKRKNGNAESTLDIQEYQLKIYTLALRLRIAAAIEEGLDSSSNGGVWNRALIQMQRISRVRADQARGIWQEQSLRNDYRSRALARGQVLQSLRTELDAFSDAETRNAARAAAIWNRVSVMPIDAVARASYLADLQQSRVSLNTVPVLRTQVQQIVNSPVWLDLPQEAQETIEGMLTRISDALTINPSPLSLLAGDRFETEAIESPRDPEEFENYLTIQKKIFSIVFLFRVASAARNRFSFMPLNYPIWEQDGNSLSRAWRGLIPSLGWNADQAINQLQREIASNIDVCYQSNIPALDSSLWNNLSLRDLSNGLDEIFKTKLRMKPLQREELRKLVTHMLELHLERDCWAKSTDVRSAVAEIEALARNAGVLDPLPRLESSSSSSSSPMQPMQPMQQNRLYSVGTRAAMVVFLWYCSLMSN